MRRRRGKGICAIKDLLFFHLLEMLTKKATTMMKNFPPEGVSENQFVAAVTNKKIEDDGE